MFSVKHAPPPATAHPQRSGIGSTIADGMSAFLQEYCVSYVCVVWFVMIYVDYFGNYRYDLGCWECNWTQGCGCYHGTKNH